MAERAKGGTPYVTVERPLRERVRRFAERYERPKAVESGLPVDRGLGLGLERG